MDPLTAVCNMLAEYIKLAAARFAASTPEQKATITAIDTKIIQDMYALVLKVREDVNKVKGLFHRDDDKPDDKPKESHATA